jgi:hypothetical protein
MKNLLIGMMALGCLSAYAGDFECTKKLRSNNRIQAELESSFKNVITRLLKIELSIKEVKFTSVEVDFSLGEISQDGFAKYTLSGSALTPRSYLTIEEVVHSGDYQGLVDLFISGTTVRDSEGVPQREKCEAILTLGHKAGEIEVKNSTYGNVVVISLNKSIKVEF